MICFYREKDTCNNILSTIIMINLIIYIESKVLLVVIISRTDVSYKVSTKVTISDDILTVCRAKKSQMQMYVPNQKHACVNMMILWMKDAVEVQWEMDLAERCKGTGEVEYILTELPISNLDALNVWQTEQKEAKLNANVKKPILLIKDPLEI